MLIFSVQAFKYLREEVKTFQGKPIMVRLFTRDFRVKYCFYWSDIVHLWEWGVEELAVG